MGSVVQVANRAVQQQRPLATLLLPLGLGALAMHHLLLLLLSVSSLGHGFIYVEGPDQDREGGRQGDNKRTLAFLKFSIVDRPWCTHPSGIANRR